MRIPDSIELTIQRLVDNQLDAGERGEFLAQAEGVPGLWRRIALAFVEEQAWREAIAPGSTASHRESDLRTRESYLDVQAKPGPGRRVANRFSRPWQLGLAAAILLAITLVLRLGTLPDRTPATSVTE
jgi:hypothetical protein